MIKRVFLKFLKNVKVLLYDLNKKKKKFKKYYIK